MLALQSLTNIMQSEDNFPVTSCYCTGTPEAREIRHRGKPHVHCPCAKCKGRAVWRMTAWRHLKQSSTELTCTPVKKACSNALEEPECLPLEPLIEYEEQDFDPKPVFWFAGSYSEFPYSSDVCAGAARMDHECEDSSSSGSCVGA